MYILHSILWIPSSLIIVLLLTISLCDYVHLHCFLLLLYATIEINKQNKPHTLTADTNGSQRIFFSFKMIVIAYFSVC